MSKIKISQLSSMALALSMVLYAFRGKYGAVLITMEAVLIMVIVFKQKQKYRSSASLFAALFLFIFAFLVHYFRSISLEYYLLIGYFTTTIILLETREEHFDTLWHWLKGISVFEAIGVFLQLLTPGLYYSIMALILPGDVVASIRNRFLTGYYTGFSREVSFTMFLIVIGLGRYLYDSDFKHNRKNWIIILFLVAALIVSGKRATLLFFVTTYFLIQFIKSDSKIKILKYTLMVIAGMALLRLTYPWWSKIPAFARVNVFIKYFTSNDIIGMTSGRTVIYENAISLWDSNKWFGIGWGNFKYSINQSQWYYGFDVHNCFIQILCETGIIGLFFYSVIIIISIVNSIRGILIYKCSNDKKAFKLAIYCSYVQLFFILYSLTEPILYEYTDYVVFFLCYNCSNLLVKKRKEVLGIRLPIKYLRNKRKYPL